MSDKYNKVFSIGFQKTGTSSLMWALKELGFNVCDGCGHAMNPNIAEEVFDICDELAEQYDAFEDHPWSVLYKRMDEKYPNSKFILTVRETEQWIKSVRSHFGESYIPLHEWIYGKGSPKGNEQLYIDRYEKHNAEVLDYFKDRPNDLLVIDFSQKRTDKQLWNDLCNFLDKPIPNVKKFPYSNSTKDRVLINKLRRIKHRVYGKKPIKVFGFQIGKDYSQY